MREEDGAEIKEALDCYNHHVSGVVLVLRQNYRPDGGSGYYQRLIRKGRSNWEFKGELIQMQTGKWDTLAIQGSGEGGHELYQDFLTDHNSPLRRNASEDLVYFQKSKLFGEWQDSIYVELLQNLLSLDI